MNRIEVKRLTKPMLLRSAVGAALITSAAGLALTLTPVPLPLPSDAPTVVRPSMIASAAMVRTPAVARIGAAAVTPSRIGSTVSSKAPKVTPGSVIVKPLRIASTSFVPVPAPDLTLVAAGLVVPARIASAAAVRVPAVRIVVAGQITPARIAAASVVRSPTFAQVAAFPIAPSALPSTSVVRAPAIAKAPPQSIAPFAVASTAAVPTPTVAGSAAKQVAPARIANNASVRQPVVLRGAVALAPARVGSAALVRAPVVSRGSVAVVPARIASQAVVRTPSVAGVSTYNAAFDPARKSFNITLSGDNRTITAADQGYNYYGSSITSSTLSAAIGVVEFTCLALGVRDPQCVGFAASGFDTTQNQMPGTRIRADGAYYVNGSYVGSANGWIAGDKVMGIVHRATGKVWFRTSAGYYPNTPIFKADGTLDPTSGAGLDSGLTNIQFIAVCPGADSIRVNAGQDAFTLSRPANTPGGWA
jgi:hypothetical protein